MQSGDSFIPIASKESLLERLPPGNFTIEQSMSGFFFKRIDKFQPLGKVYGNLNSWADRTLETFAKRDVSTGILLTGEKGSGKSLLGRLISLKAYEQNMATVLVNNPFPGPILLDLLGKLTEPVVVFFDEFEKVYNDLKEQQTLLSLMDGTLSTKHLFVITCNDTWRLSDFLLNRPGRIFYYIEFDGIKEDFIKEYCQDNLNNKSEIDNVVKISAIFEKFNFDMLKALVEEMNRYNESAMKAIELLNITPTKQNVTYKLSIEDKKGKKYHSSPNEWDGFPLEKDKFNISAIAKDSEDEDWIYLEFLNTHLKQFDPSSKTFTYVNDKGYILTFESDKKKSTMYWGDAI